ncbi:MAG TPA: hypothetical protein VIJ95_19105 [Hanamia sp.]
MKTVISNNIEEALEVAKHILYSLKVVIIGLFIPFVFVFGITYNTPKEASADGIKINTSQKASNEIITVDFNKPLSDQNS